MLGYVSTQIWGCSNIWEVPEPCVVQQFVSKLEYKICYTRYQILLCMNNVKPSPNVAESQYIMA